MTTPNEAPSGQDTAQQQNQPEFGSDEYEAAFQQQLTKMGKGATTSVATNDDDSEIIDPEDDDSAPSEVPGAEGADKPGASAAEPAKKEPPAGDDKPESAAPAKAAAADPAKTDASKTPESDPLGELPEDKKAQIKALLDAADAARQEAEHKFRSAQGRLAKLEGKIGAAPAAPTQVAGKTAASPQSAKSERYQQFEQDYPEVAQAFEERLAGLAASLPQAEAIEFLRQAREDKIANERVVAVQTVHPRFVEAVSSPEFDTWAVKQSDAVKRLINSDNPDEVCVAMDLFVVHHPQFKGTPSPASQAAASTGSVTDPAAEKLRLRREAQLKALDPGVRSSKPVTDEELGTSNDDALFARALEKAARSRGLPYTK